MSRELSKLYGYFFRKTIPEEMRPFFFNGFSKIFRVDLDEIELPINEYTSMNEFFIRKLKPNARVIEKDDLVSPCDSRVMSFGRADEKILSVKGSNYSLVQLLRGDNSESFLTLKKKLLSSPDNDLFYITLYLAPGDYHRFHTPADFQLEHRRHIYGYMQGVFSWNLWRKSDVFATNERVVYTGNWKYGKMVYITVAAFNVGDIKINCDPELVTNKGSLKNRKFEDLNISKEMKKGEEFGVFRAGSTIIMVFEAPKDMKWIVNLEDRVLVGNRLVDLA